METLINRRPSDLIELSYFGHWLGSQFHDVKRLTDSGKPTDYFLPTAASSLASRHSLRKLRIMTHDLVAATGL
jgi:hypothetical protein